MDKKLDKLRKTDKSNRYGKSDDSKNIDKDYESKNKPGYQKFKDSSTSNSPH